MQPGRCCLVWRGVSAVVEDFDALPDVAFRRVRLKTFLFAHFTMLRNSKPVAALSKMSIPKSKTFWEAYLKGDIGAIVRSGLILISIFVRSNTAFYT